MQDFEAAINRAGFDPSDFNPVVVEDERSPEPQPVTGTVTVTRESSGVAKTYRAGHVSIWVAEFDQDLKAGLFGSQ
jgi:hypothetical protein